MKKNMGNVDRLVRVVLGVVFWVLILTGTITGTLAWVLGILGVVFILTSALGICCLYIPFGLSTCKAKKEAPAEGEAPAG